MEQSTKDFVISAITKIIAEPPAYITDSEIEALVVLKAEIRKANTAVDVLTIVNEIIKFIGIASNFWDNIK